MSPVTDLVPDRAERVAALLRAVVGHRGQLATDVAEALGVTRQTVSSWMRGTAMPPPSRLAAIEDLVGLEQPLLQASASSARVFDPFDEATVAAWFDALEGDPAATVRVACDDDEVREVPVASLVSWAWGRYPAGLTS